MRLFLILLCLTLIVNSSVAKSTDTLFVDSQSRDFLFDSKSKPISFENFIENNVYLAKNTSLYSGVIVAEIIDTSIYSGGIYRNVFVGNYKEGEIQSSVRVSFGGGQFSEDSNENRAAGVLLASHKKISDKYKGKRCGYSVDRKNYLDSTSSYLSMSAYGATDDTTRYTVISFESNIKIRKVVLFDYEDGERTAYTVKSNDKCIVDIQGDGIIYLDLMGKVITKEAFLLIAEFNEFRLMDTYGFLEEDPTYYIIFHFFGEQDRDYYFNIRKLLKKQHKLDRKLNK